MQTVSSGGVSSSQVWTGDTRHDGISFGIGCLLYLI